MANEKPKPKPPKRPSIKTEKFVKEMAKPSNESPRRAAIKAGFSEKTAAAAASRLLKNVNVNDRIEKRKAEVAKYANITDAQVLGATALRAFATIDDVIDANGDFDIKKARRTGAVHLIKKITKTKNKYGTTTAVEFYSNESAQDRLGQYLGMEKQAATNPADNISIAKRVVQELKADGKTHAEAVEYAISRYGVLEADLIGS